MAFFNVEMKVIDFEILTVKWWTRKFKIWSQNDINIYMDTKQREREELLFFNWLLF